MKSYKYIINKFANRLSNLEMQENSKKNKYGQYFTPYDIANFMVKLSCKKPTASVLEPSCGEGIFIDTLLKNGFKNITALEIDNSLSTKYDFITYESFVTKEFNNQKFDLIIGNPPYIRWKNLEDELKIELQNNTLWNKYFNSLCDYLYIFILKSIELLNDNGELIFICPEYWMNTTNALKLRNYMVKNGYFESIIHFNETPIFENANVSIVIFKFIKSKTNTKPNINVYKYFSSKKITNNILNNILDNTFDEHIKNITVPQFEENERWILDEQIILDELKKIETICTKNTLDLFSTSFEYDKIGDFYDIGNGMVSGLDKVFQIENYDNLNETEILNSIRVLKAKDLNQYSYKNITNYIFINHEITEDEFKITMPNFYEQLNVHRDKLLNRYLYNRDIKFWEWVFLRNYKLFSKNQDKIFIPCKERISHKDYFRFTYVDKDIFPTQDVTAIYKKDNTQESIYYLLSYLNLPIIFNWIKNKGIVKGNIVEFSEKPISSIPYRKINWSNNHEVQLHNEIVTLTIEHIKSNNNTTILINKFEQLFKIK